MAMSLGSCWLSSLAAEPAVSRSSSILSLVSVPNIHYQPANLRTSRFVTSAAQSKPSTTKKREPTGIMIPKPISAAMQQFLGVPVPEIPRTEALKKIWAYIKEHNLQDPENRKIIVCDEKLKNIFGGRERVGFLEISGLINPHFAKGNSI